MIEMNAGHEVVPSGPLCELILKDCEREVQTRSEIDPTFHSSKRVGTPGLSLLATRIEMNERVLYRCLRQPRVRVETADRYCSKTGRSLWEVYPDLYPEPEPTDVYIGECRECAYTRMDVLLDGKRRLHLRCRECGTGQYIERDPSWRKLPRPHIQVRFDYVEAQRLYEEEGLTLREVAKLTGVSYGSVRRYLLEHVTPRQRGGSSNGGVYAAHRFISERRVERTRRARELRVEGYSAVEIAKILGVSRRTVWNLWAPEAVAA